MVLFIHRRKNDEVLLTLIIRFEVIELPAATIGVHLLSPLSSVFLDLEQRVSKISLLEYLRTWIPNQKTLFRIFNMRKNKCKFIVYIA